MTFKKYTKLLLIALSLSLPVSAMAQSLAQRTSPRVMEGVRPQGMGGAFIAVDGTDENALFYNPAAINDFENKVHMKFLLPSVNFSYKAIPFFSNDLTDLADDIDAAGTDAAKIGVFNQFKATNTGRYEEIGIHGSIANFMYKWVSAALFYDNSSVLGLLNPASSEITLESVSTGGLQVGSAYSFFDNNLQAGLALKFVERHLISETITQRDVIANAEFDDAISFGQAGFGIGFDLGVKGKIPWDAKAWKYLDPTFALTLQDVGDTRFFAGDNVGHMEESLSAGLALHPNFGKFTSIFALDVRDLDRRTDFITKLHAGYELTWPEISKVLRSISARVGMNQGYVTGGLGFDFKYVQLNMATYGKEVGINTRQKQSRMFGFQLATGF